VNGMDAYVVDVVRTPFGKGRESGILAGVYPFRGETVELNQFLGVREDLFKAHPYPGLRNPAPLSLLDE